MKRTNTESVIVLFDGMCNMCVRSVQFIIKRDNKDVFRFASIQSVIGQELIKRYSIDIKKNDSILVIKDEHIRYRSSAALYILGYLKTIWKILLVFYLIPAPIRDALYNLIAKKRYFWFGKKNKCMIPDSSISAKFLSL
jgi:predicted DCC family thiol-disulfide oxidoreductase YuxK